MRHRDAVMLSGGGRLVAAASVVAMAVSAAVLASVLVTVGEDTRRVGSPDGHVTADETTADEDAPVARTPSAAHRPARPSARRWHAVLAMLDRRRSRAYAEANPRLLDDVYAHGSTVLHRDRALLTRYRHRGLRVRGLRMRVAVVQVHRRRPNQVLLRVRDRVVSGTVVGPEVARPLPYDGLDTRWVTLHRSGTRPWRIAAVRPVHG